MAIWMMASLFDGEAEDHASAKRGSLAVILCLVVTLLAEAAIWTIRDHLIASVQEREIKTVRIEARAKALDLRETLSRTLDQIGALQSLASLVTRARQTGNTDMEQAARAELGVRRESWPATLRAFSASRPRFIWIGRLSIRTSRGTMSATARSSV